MRTMWRSRFSSTSARRCGRCWSRCPSARRRRRARPRAEIDELCGRFANWLVLAHHVAGRGELLRARDALGHVQRHLLWMARLVAGRTEHWLTPSRCAERELPPDPLAELRGIAVADNDVHAAIRCAWRCGRRWWIELARRHGGAVPQQLFAEIDAAMASRAPRGR